MSHTWDPDRYLAYADERGRPFVDLLARVPRRDAAGRRRPGLRPGQPDRPARRPLAGGDVTGIDSSAEMIAAAREVDGATWEVADLRDWARPDPLALRAPVDVLVSNATLQWLPDHLELLPDRVDRVAAGRLVRLPGARQLRRAEPHDPRRLAERAPYAEHVRDVAVPASHEPADYARVLLDLGCEVDAWETTYLHVLTGDDPVFDWVSGTGARPTIQALPDGSARRLRGRVPRAAARGLPGRRRGRVVMPFRRIFVVARKPRRVRRLMRLHHVQVACPPGGEDVARRFYADGLGHDRGRQAGRPRGPRRLLVPGVRRLGRVAAELHVGVEDPFAPARKAHPAFVVDDLDEVAAPAARLGFEVDELQRDSFPGHVRFHAFDGHGNRVEVLAGAEASPAPSSRSGRDLGPCLRHRPPGVDLEA